MQTPPYTPADTPIFEELDHMGLLLIEQPFHYDDIVDHAGSNPGSAHLFAWTRASMDRNMPVGRSSWEPAGSSTLRWDGWAD
jgi:O-succinylbenzoate synthase (EC 4.2.1.-)